MMAPVSTNFLVKFHHVRHADQPQAKGADAQAAHDTYVPYGFRRIAMHALVHHVSLYGQPILCPEPFDVDQGSLALAEHQVLQG